MRFIETIPREVSHKVKHFVCRIIGNTFLTGTLNELVACLRHYLDHRPAGLEQT